MKPENAEFNNNRDTQKQWQETAIAGLTKRFPLHAHCSGPRHLLRTGEKEKERERVLWGKKGKLRKARLLMKAFSPLSEHKHLSVVSHSLTFKWLCQLYGTFIKLVR